MHRSEKVAYHRGTERIKGTLFWDESGFGFIDGGNTEPRFYIPYTSLTRWRTDVTYKENVLSLFTSVGQLTEIGILDLTISDPNVRASKLRFSVKGMKKATRIGEEIGQLAWPVP